LKSKVGFGAVVPNVREAAEAVAERRRRGFAFPLLFSVESP
jgi:hypothetical protein